MSEPDADESEQPFGERGHHLLERGAATGLGRQVGRLLHDRAHEDATDEEGRHHAEEQGDGGASSVRRQGGADAERHEREDDEGDDRPPEQGEGVLGPCHRGLAVRHVLAAVDHQLTEVVGQVAADGVLELGDLLLGVTVGGELGQVDAGEDPAVLEPLEPAAQERQEVHLDVLALHA